MKIGIFGGTFNPVHNGHINITKDIKNELDLDVVYFVPSYLTADKQFHIEDITSKDRLKMVSKVLKQEKLPYLKLSNFEFKQKGVSYTYITIRYFRDKFPNDELYWIMGEDRYSDFNKWEGVEEIRELAKIVIYRRKPEISKTISNDKSVIYCKKKFYDISSTNILNNLEWEHIPESAREYISKKKLYLKTVVFRGLKHKRYQHSVAVSSHAKRLAKEYHYKNIKKAELVGLVHDLFKLREDEELIKYYEKYFNKKYDYTFPLPALHGLIVAEWLKNEYKWDDKEVYNALARHTLAHPEATKFDKIIFVADKISTDRKGDKVGKLRKLAYNNLDETYKKIIKETIKNLKARNIEPHNDTKLAFEKWVNKNKGELIHEFNIKKNKRKPK